MNTQKMRQVLGGCMAAAVVGAMVFTASAKGQVMSWFDEDSDTVTYALGHSGQTASGTWSTDDDLASVLKVESETVVLDVDAELPLNYGLKTAGKLAETPIVEGQFTFDRAYAWSTLAAENPDSKAGLCLAKDSETIKFAYVVKDEGVMKWALSTVVVADPAVAQDIRIKVENGTLTYSVLDPGEGEYVTIGTSEIGTAGEVVAAQFTGAGSFTTFFGQYTLEALAQIGENYYRTVEEAQAAVTAGCTVKLFADNVTWTASGDRINYAFDVTSEGCFPPAVLNDDALKAKGLKGTVKADGSFVASVNLVGDGLTAATAFEIATKDDLDTFKKGLAADVYTADEKFFKQTATIDLAGIAWEGLASEDSPFTGTYDGQGFRIDNMTLKDGEYVAFFNVTQNATIKNLTIKSLGFQTSLANAIENTVRVNGAIFIGEAFDGTVVDACVAEGAIWGTHNAAGFTSFSRGGVSFLNCTNRAAVSGNYTKVAGFAAYNQNGTGATVFNGCVNEGAIAAVGTVCVLKTDRKPGDDGVAGILGWSGTDVQLVNCENKGTLTGVAGSQIGSFIGERGSTVVDPATGCTAVPGYRSVSNGGVPSLVYAKDVEGVADFCCPNGAADLVKDELYYVTQPVANDAPVFTLQAAGDTISFDTTVAGFAGDPVAGGEGLLVQAVSVGNVSTYTAVAAEAKIGAKLYGTLAEAFENVAADETIALLKDVTVADEIAATRDLAFDLDLGGHTLTSLSTEDAIWLRNNTTTISDGTIACPDGAQTVYQSSGSLTIAADVTISGKGGLVFFNGATTVIDGTIVASAEFAASGNGSDPLGCTVTVGATASITSASGTALYWPNKGTLTVKEGAVISGGKNGIYAKSGMVTIEGGEISSTAAALVTPVADNDGIEAEGYALVLETGSEQGGYANNLAFSITGGKFTSAVGPAVLNFVRTDADPVAAGIEGGLFKGAVDSDVALIVAKPDKIAEWIDSETAGYKTPNWRDADPWPAPARDEDVKQAMIDAGFSEEVAECFPTVASYDELKNWSKNQGLDPADVKADATLFLFAAGAETINETVALEIDEMTAAEADGAFTLAVSVADKTIVNGALLAKLIGIEATTALGDETKPFSADNADVAASAFKDGKVVVTVAPAEALDNPGTFFMRATPPKADAE